MILLEKKLPKVFANKINKNAGNNKNVFYSENNNVDETFSVSDKNMLAKNINQKINEIFNSPNYIYKADVIIKLKDKTIDKRIIGKNSSNLITIENELIPISSIVDIKLK